MKTLRDCCVIFGSTLVTFSAITLIVYHASASDVQFRKRHLDRRRKKLNVLRQRNKKNRSGHKTVSKSALSEEIIPPLAELGLVAYYEEGELERVATRLIIRELAVNPVALKRLSMMLSSTDIEDREFATDFLLFYLLRVSQGRADLSSYPIMYGLVLGFDRCLDTLKELKEEGKEDPVAFSRNLALFMNYNSILTQLCEDARHLHPAHQLCLYGFVDLCYKWNEIAPFSDRVWKPGMIPNIRDVQNKTSRFPYTYHVLQDVIIADYQMESTIEGLVEKLGGSGDDFSRSEEQMMATREFLTQFYESRMEEMPQFETPEESLAAARDFLVFFYDNYYDSVRRAEREIQNGTESDDTDDDDDDRPALPRVARAIPNVPVPPIVPVDDAYTSEEDTCSEREMPRGENNPEHYLGECVDDESVGECEVPNCECRGRQVIYPVGLPPEDGYDDHVHEEEGDDDDDEDDGEGGWEDDDEDEFGEDDEYNDYDDGYGYDDDVYEDEFGRAFVGGLEAEEFMNPMNYIDPNSGGTGPLTLNRETGQFDLSPGALDIINELRATGVLPAYGSPGRQPDGPNGGANGPNGGRR